MRIGMICPYSFDVPGGVQAHILEIADEMIKLGHEVEVLGPGTTTKDLPYFVTVTGYSIPIPFNGSVARLGIGLRHWNAVRKFIEEGDFDVVHLHEPASPSLSMWCTYLATGPLVCTFHASGKPSLLVRLTHPFLSRRIESISGRIAVSNMARRYQMESIGGDAVLIPNGVRVSKFQDAAPLAGYEHKKHPVVLFLGRYDEPRKGMDVLKKALPLLRDKYPTLELMVVGNGNQELLEKELAGQVGKLTMLGHVSEADKASALRSADVYVAPNTGGESFGIVLVEAMSAGTAVVASDIPAFTAVLDNGEAGWIPKVGDGTALAEALDEALSNISLRTQKVVHATQKVAQYDWAVVTRQVLRVYETVTLGAEKVTLQ
ncbi:MAG: glycosyltransferase family 4 protein [Lawsonella sp.]